jgi:hypothetical protein
MMLRLRVVLGSWIGAVDDVESSGLSVEAK